MSLGRALRTLLGVLLILGAATTPCWAHKPIEIGAVFPSQTASLRLETVDVSQVVYTELTPDHPQLWLTFDAAAGFALSVSLGVPAGRGAAYRPSLFLLGPGMPNLDLPLSPPAGYGGLAVVSAVTAAAIPFHEPFTGTDSWILVERTFQLRASGTYYLVAVSDDSPLGKLWVAVGTREAFSWKDIVSLPATVRDVRSFHEVPTSRGGSLGKVLFLVGSATLIGLLAWTS
ncbi:MAG: hypothetical protein NTY63_08240 [Candidatus Bipolaricaulota bacterium]|nr:hypothetical protein [Candidatus Bipolaricaulota bacterium]